MRRIWSVAFMAVGIAAIVLAALADLLGLGDGGFGYKQVLGVLVGVGLVGVGVALMYIRRRSSDSAQTAE